MRAIIFALITIAASTVWAAEPKVGVLLWTEEAHYSDTVKAAQKELARQGISIKYDIQCAKGSKPRAIDIAKRFAQGDYAVIIPVGTSAALVAKNEVYNKPIVFGMIYDPIAAGIVNSWDANGGNITGASAKVAMNVIFTEVKNRYAVKTIGVLYKPGEKNSEAILRDIMKNSPVKVLPVPINTKEDLLDVLPQLQGLIDVLYIAGGSSIGGNLSDITQFAAKMKLTTISHIESYADQGVNLIVCSPAEPMGIEVGKLTAKILRGTKPGSLPIWQTKTPKVSER